MGSDYETLRKKIIKRLEKELKSSRLYHTLGVEATAVALAVVHRADPRDASIAALLHDVAKYVDKDKLLKIIGKSPYADFYGDLRPYPKLLHAFAGAEIVHSDFPELSENIIQAIRFHTTGRPEMGTLEKIIFAADYIEPGRKVFPGLNEARALVFADLDDGIRLILKQTIAYLDSDNDTPIYPLTMRTYEAFQKNV